jgi:hypothetical protein
MQNDQNRVAGVHGNGTMNTTILIFRTRLWPSCETREHHVLNVFRLYSLWDVKQSKILSNRHIIPAWKLSFFTYFLAFFCVSYKKSHNLYGTN